MFIEDNYIAFESQKDRSKNGQRLLNAMKFTTINKGFKAISNGVK